MRRTEDVVEEDVVGSKCMKAKVLGQTERVISRALLEDPTIVRKERLGTGESRIALLSVWERK